MARDWKWDVDVDAFIGRFCALETADGIRREGRITGVGMKELILDGRPCRMPMHIELNGDPQDRIDFARISSFNLTG